MDSLRISVPPPKRIRTNSGSYVYPEKEKGDLSGKKVIPLSTEDFTDEFEEIYKVINEQTLRNQELEQMCFLEEGEQLAKEIGPNATNLGF